MFVQAIGFGNDHVKHDGEGFHYHHAHAAMVMIFEAKGCDMVVDAKCAPSAKHTASRTRWLHTCKESQDVPVNFP
jgi:hypothetical protein